MNILVKVQHKGRMTIPSKVRSAVGLVDGGLVEVRAAGRKIVITPQLVIDRSTFPSVDDEYTPSQRRAINARLARADRDIQAGRVSKAFSDPEEFLADLHRAARLRVSRAKRPVK